MVIWRLPSEKYAVTLLRFALQLPCRGFSPSKLKSKIQSQCCLLLVEFDYQVQAEGKGEKYVTLLSD